MGPIRAWALAILLAQPALAPAAAAAEGLTPQAIREAVEAHIGPDVAPGALRLWQPGDPGGTSIVVLVKDEFGRAASSFFSFGCAVGTKPSADAPCAVDKEQRPPETMSSDTVVDLASVGKLFAAIQVARGVLDRQIDLNNSIADPKYRLPLTGACIRTKTVGAIVSQSSGLPDFPVRRGCPAPPGRQFDYPLFAANLNCWGSGPQGCPPSQHYLYSDVGFILLRLALAGEANHMPFPNMVKAFADDVRMTATTMDVRPARSPVAQGYRCIASGDEEGADRDCDGAPVAPQEEQKATWYQDRWGNGGQIWSSARDMALLAELALNAKSGRPSAETWLPAMQKTEEVLFDKKPRVAMAWQESVTPDGTTILGKNGGNSFTSTYIGLTTDRRIAVVILVNRGGANAARAGQQILGRLAKAGS